VGIGADINVELDQNDAIGSLETKREEIEEMKDDTEGQIERVEDRLEDVAQQAQRAQMGGGQGPPGAGGGMGPGGA
jgi:prefoldin subunit 5